MQQEEWRDVPGFGGHYRVSSRGRVLAKRRTIQRVNRWGEVADYNYRPHLLRPYVQKNKNNPSGKGYKTVHISWDGKRQTVMVHHMVLLAFHGPRPAGHFGCHTDGNSLNNSPDNLRWDTHHGNMQDRKRHGRYPRGGDHPMAKVSDAVAREIRQSGLTGYAAAKLFGISKTQAYRIKNGERLKSRAAEEE